MVALPLARLSTVAAPKSLPPVAPRAIAWCPAAARSRSALVDRRSDLDPQRRHFIVSAGDHFGAQISGGTQVVFGSAHGATAFGAPQARAFRRRRGRNVVPGGDSAVVSARGGEINAEDLERPARCRSAQAGSALNTTASSGGLLAINTGGTGSGSLLSGGEEIVSGSKIGAVIASGGFQVVSRGASRSAPRSGAAARQDILSAGTAHPHDDLR